MGMFKPSHQLKFVKEGTDYRNMGKLSSFLDKIIHIQMKTSGVPCYIYRYQGTFDQEKDYLGVKHDKSGTTKSELDIGSFMGIEDPLLMENRDRKYNFEEVPVINGVYTISGSEVELLRFGFSTNEVLTVEFSQSEVESALNRRFMIGDVCEFPHMKDVGLDGRTASRWYEVKSLAWSHGGIEIGYINHMVSVILQPIRHQQEFLDILHNVRDPDTGELLKDNISNEKHAMNITKALQDKAIEHAPSTKFDTRYMYYYPEDPNKKPELFTDDGLPPNSEPVNQGQSFPTNVSDGAWFLRDDMIPNRLYQLSSNRWVLREVDRKREWQPYGYVSKFREFVSDNTDKDNNRPWKLENVHDVLTNREGRS